MREVEVSNYLKKLILDIKNIRENIENSFEYGQILEKIEKINSLAYSDENASEEKELYNSLNDMKTKAIESYLKKISDDDMKTILLSLSPDFMQLNHFTVGDALNPQNEFELVINYCLKNVEDRDCELHNSLLKNANFTAAIDNSYGLLNELIDKSNDEDFIEYFILKYAQFFKPISPFNFESNYIFYSIVESFINSTNYSNELKKKILKDDRVIFHITPYLFEKISLKSPLLIADKMELYTSVVRSYLKFSHHLESAIENANSYFTKVIIPTIKNLDDLKRIFHDEQMIKKISFEVLLSNIEIDSSIIDYIINDDNIFKRLNAYQIKQLIIDAKNIDFEVKKNYILNGKIFSRFKGYVGEFFSQSSFTSSQLYELLTTQLIIENIQENDLDSLLRSSTVELDLKNAIIKNSELRKKISIRTIKNIIKSKDISLEMATELMLDKYIFYRMINEYHEIYNNSYSALKGPFDYDKYEYMKKLYENNNGLAFTINYELFRDDILSDWEFETIEILCKYPYTAKRFVLMYHRDAIFYFENMLGALVDTSHGGEIDGDILINRIMDCCLFTSVGKKDTRFSIIKKKIKPDLSSMTQKRWRALTEIALRDNSLYYKSISIDYANRHMREKINILLNLIPDINSVEDLDNYQALRINLCDNTFKECIDKKDLDGAKNAYFNKYFNINIDEAREIVRLYGYSIDKFKNNNEYLMQVKYINNLKMILNITKINTLNECYNNKEIKELSFDESIYIDDSIKKIFSKELSDSVYKIDKEKDASYIEIPTLIDGNIVMKKIKVYEPGLDFKILVHSTCAYGEMELINNNYFDSWNKSSRKSNHGICCSLIANDNLGMAEVNDVLFGFDSWGENAITKSAPYDLSSYNDEIVSHENRSLKFMTADDIINNTRHTHNEQVLERYELRSDKRTAECQNIQPSYVIIYSDMSDEIKAKAVKCSNEMNIPIVYLDKEKIIKNEVRKIDDKIKKIYDPGTIIDEKINFLEQVLTSHENNRSGLRVSNSDLVDMYFPTSKIEIVLNDLVKMIQEDYEKNNDIISYYKNGSKLMDALEKEKEKFDVTMETTHRKNYIDIPVDEYRKRIMQYISPNLAKNNIPKLEKIISNANDEDLDLPIDNFLKNIDFTSYHKIIEDIVSKQLYPNDDLNLNIEYVEKMVLFSEKIGSKELVDDSGVVDKHSLDMLIECAKYCNCGKTSIEDNIDDGIKSSAKMKECLKESIYSSDDKSIMQAVVEYYNCNYNDGTLNEICSKYAIKNKEYVKKLSDCLIDAKCLINGFYTDYDAIEEPFISGTSLNFSSSSEFVLIAKLLNEKYKNIDRKQFEKICIDIYNNQLQSQTNQQNDSRRVTI